jgi:hypothetical protein
VPSTEGGDDVLMAEVNTSAAEDQRGEAPLANEGGEPSQSGLPMQEAPEPSRHQGPNIPESSGGEPKYPRHPRPLQGGFLRGGQKRWRRR